MRLRTTPSAEGDLDEIWIYVARESGSVEIANRVVDAITGAFSLLVKFTGYESDAETTSDYATYRNLRMTLGRFNRPDPYHGSYDSANPQSLNRYAYVGNNPIVAIDSIGLARGPSNPQYDSDSICGTWDGLDLPCSWLGWVLGGVGGPGGGAAVQCPNNDCSPVYGKDPYTGQPTWLYFTASASGAQGYLSLYDWTQGVNDLNGQFLSDADYQLYAPSTDNPFKQWPLNGDLLPGIWSLPDYKCSVPVLGPLMDSNHGMKSACIWHDNMYAAYECNASSWIPWFPGPCQAFNIVLVIRLFGALF